MQFSAPKRIASKEGSWGLRQKPHEVNSFRNIHDDRMS